MDCITIERRIKLQGRKFLLTINNPLDKGITHDTIKIRLSSLKSLVYYCIADEIGANEHTPHTHIFVIYQNPKVISTIKNLFPESHIDLVRGSNSQNRDYVLKQGKWQDTEKGTTSIPESQEEYGTLPEDKRCCKPELGILYELIKEGRSNYEILEEHPEYIKDISDIEKTRMILKQEEFKNSWRELEITYIFGKSGTGKSRYVMETYQYQNVFRVTDYVHPFDNYFAENILMFEEFNSSLRIQDMLNYLDGYPIKLPARYSDKIGCYKKVFFTTNIPLEQQYPNVQKETPEIWKAFLRRITKVIYFKSFTEIITYNSVDEYLNRDTPFEPIPIQETIPFD